MDTTTMSTGAAAAILGVLAAYIVVVLILTVLWIVANWKIFTKADEAGWKSIIPIYNQYTLFKLTWKTSMFWIMLALSFVSGIVTSLMDNTAGEVISAIVLIAAAVINIMQMHQQSKAFGHGAGFTCGLVFLNTIFVMILAFGSSQYLGNPSETDVSEQSEAQKEPEKLVEVDRPAEPEKPDDTKKDE